MNHPVSRWQPTVRRRPLVVVRGFRRDVKKCDIIGLGAPFLLTDLSKFIGWNLPYSLPAAIGLGGLIIGIWQAFILRTRVRQSGWWIAASVLGWTLAAGTPALADSPRLHAIRGIWGALAYLGIIAAGGLILGIITGLCLAWLVRSESAA